MIFSVLKLGGKLDKYPENGITMLISKWKSIFGRIPQKLGSSGSAFPLDNPKKGKILISSIFRRISRRMKGFTLVTSRKRSSKPPGFIEVTSKRKFTRKAGSAAKTEGPMAESSRPSAPTSGTETSGKAGAGPLGKAASAGMEATAAVTSVTAVTFAPAAAVTAVTVVTSAVLGPKGPVAGPSGAAGSRTTPEDNRPVKILLNLRRQFTAYKGNVLNYCMTVKRIKFKLIRIKAWTLGSCLIERLNSLQACRTSRSCGRVRQVDYSVFRKIASWDLGRQLFGFSGISILDLGSNYCIQRKV